MLLFKIYFVNLSSISIDFYQLITKLQHLEYRIFEFKFSIKKFSQSNDKDKKRHRPRRLYQAVTPAMHLKLLK